MYFLKSMGIEFFSAAVLLLPFFLAVRRIRRPVLYFLSLYFAGLYLVTGLPTVLFAWFDPRFYLLPFVGMAEDIKNSILNVLLFLPLGFLVPLFCGRFRSFHAALLLGVSCSLFIELAQIFTYRLSDVNDLVTNTTGAVLGYLLAKPLFPRTVSLPQISVNALALTAGITVCVMFFLQPLLVNLIWYLIP